MSIYEYDEGKHMRQTREEGFEDGFKDGFKDGHASGYGEGHQDGICEGREQERARINCLIQKLSTVGRIDDIIKAAEDPEFQKNLLEEFEL